MYTYKYDTDVARFYCNNFFLDPLLSSCEKTVALKAKLSLHPSPKKFNESIKKHFQK